MKIKHLLTKTLLVAAGLLVGQNVWAAVGDKTTNLDIDFSNAISEGKVAGATGSMTIGGSNTTITDGILIVGNGTSSATLTGSAAGSGDQVEVTFDLAFGKLSGKNVWFRLKDSEGSIIGEFDFCPYAGTLTNSFGVETGDMYYGSNTVIWERKVSFTITLNYKTRKITTATTCYKSGTGKSATNAEHTVDMTNSNPLVTFEIGSNYNNDGRRCSFDNLKVVTTEGEAVAAASYTINYKLGTNVVKTVAKSDGVVGQVVTADKAIDGTEAGYVGNHYLITAGTAPTITLVADAASNVLDVPVRAPYTATLTVTKNINGEAQTPEVTNLVETDEKVCSWIYAYPMYVEKGGVYYIADETTTFGESGTFTDGQSISKTVNYATAATDVVWFKDINAGSVSDVAYSGGGYTTINEELANVTVDAGVYEVIFNVVSKAGSGGSHRNEGVSVNGTNVANLTGNVNGLRTLTITVTSDASTITAYGNGSSNYTDNLDYVLIRKTADLPSTENIVVTDAGYATYVSNYNLDFTSATTKAYKVHVAEKGVATMTEVAKVPAKTPVLLYKEGGNGSGEAIPVTTDAVDAVTGNDLVAGNSTTATEGVATTDGEYTNMILNNIGGNVGFYFANGQNVAANRAYLHFDSSLAPDAAAPMLLQLDNENLTGISVASATSKNEGVVYDLQGRKVANPTKGLYIVNGRKAIIK